jgi:mRNA interferase RelE/StbE
VADQSYRLSLAPAARPALTESPPTGVPLAIAMAIGEFLTGPLLDNPQRLGKPLARDLAGYHSARRGSYRIVYRIDDQTHTVYVVRIDHRAHVYRPCP